jgi:hypothetical protein
LFLIDNKSQELKLVSSAGLSDEYLDKGPINALRSIADSLKDGPVAISNVADDPRIQYPAEAQKEGIASILSVPIIAREKPVGAIRVYTSEPWEVTLDDVNFVQAVAQISGMALETARLYKGLKNSIEILKANTPRRGSQKRRKGRRTACRHIDRPRLAGQTATCLLPADSLGSPAGKGFPRGRLRGVTHSAPNRFPTGLICFTMVMQGYRRHSIMDWSSR